MQQELKKTKIVEAAAELRDSVSRLNFSLPVEYVYNPLEYAWLAHEQFLNRYGAGKKRITAYPLPLLSKEGFQSRSSAPLPLVLIFSTSATNLEVSDPKRDCFLRSEKDIDLACVIRFGLCDYIIEQSYSFVNSLTDFIESFSHVREQKIAINILREPHYYSRLPNIVSKLLSTRVIR